MANKSKFVSGEVRFSYLNIFEPKASSYGGDAKYSVTILMPKSDTASKQRLDAVIAQVRQEAVSEKWGGVNPPLVQIAIHDGDGVKPNSGEPYGDECKGHWVLTASSKTPPDAVDQNLNPFVTKTELYSGCYGRVGINPFAYNSNGRKGIGFGLNTIQKLRDGEPLGGGNYSAASDFAAPTGGYTPPAAQIDPITGLPMARG